MTQTEKLIELLESLKRYDCYAETPGCECCGAEVVWYPDEFGTWIKKSDINDIIQKLKEEV